MRRDEVLVINDTDDMTFTQIVHDRHVILIVRTHQVEHPLQSTIVVKYSSELDP